jgi:Ni/Co efflux regulator RcnB
MSKEIKKVVIIDAPNYFFADQGHLLEKIRGSFGTAPVYFVVNPENRTWQQASQKFMKVWSRYNAMIKLSKNVDMDLVEDVIKESDAKKVVVGSNDGKLLWQIAEKAVAKPVYLRITYKQKNGKWMRPPYVLEKLRNHGYTVIDWRLVNRIEGALARMLMLDFDAALELWEQREKFKRSVVLAKERVLPQIEGKITLQGFSALCEKEKILYPFETVYFLALFGNIDIQSKNGVVLISPKKERKEVKQEELVRQEKEGEEVMVEEAQG